LSNVLKISNVRCYRDIDFKVVFHNPEALKSNDFANVSTGLEGLEFGLLIVNIFNDFNIVLFVSDHRYSYPVHSTFEMSS